MYHPYFRGKQFELIAVRETAELLARARFVPIIEPVKETLRGLDRTLKAVCEAHGRAIVVVNPQYGDLTGDGTEISALLNKGYLDKDNISAGILLKGDMELGAAFDRYEEHRNHDPTFIHAGFTHPKALADALGVNLATTRHVFLEKNCGKLYRKHFLGASRILLRDGFQRRQNADYKLIEEFSDLHVTFEEEGMDGFGDFLIVGDDFSESGGPAYAVAIHLTYIDPDKDDVMYIYHFVSTTKDTPIDPGGKFGQALDKLNKMLDSGKSHLLATETVKEFQELHSKGHYPGLGHVKKMSMKHHIETLADYFA